MHDFSCPDFLLGDFLNLKPAFECEAALRKQCDSFKHGIILKYSNASPWVYFGWFNLAFGRVSLVTALHACVDRRLLWNVCNSYITNPVLFIELQSQNASKSEDQSELISRMKSLELDNKNLHKGVYMPLFGCVFLCISIVCILNLIFMST